MAVAMRRRMPALGTVSVRKVAGRPSGWRVKRANGATTVFEGPDYGCVVNESGALIITFKASTAHVFAPGQWVTVNEEPVMVEPAAQAR